MNSTIEPGTDAGFDKKKTGLGMLKALNLLWDEYCFLTVQRLNTRENIPMDGSITLMEEFTQLENWDLTVQNIVLVFNNTLDQIVISGATHWDLPQ